MKEQVIELAKQAGAVVEAGLAPVFSSHAELHLFATLVGNAKLEEAAKTCDGLNNSETNSAHRYDQGTTERRAWNQATTDCAAAIQKLKKPTP